MLQVAVEVVQHPACTNVIKLVVRRVKAIAPAHVKVGVWLVVLAHVLEHVQDQPMLYITALTAIQFVLLLAKMVVRNHVLAVARRDVILHVKEHAMQSVRTHALQVAKLIVKVDAKEIAKEVVLAHVKQDVKEHVKAVVLGHAELVVGVSCSLILGLDQHKSV